MATSKLFKKGDIAFQACDRFADNYKPGRVATREEMRVISRVVDACGAKQITFENRGYDRVFGRKRAVMKGMTVFKTAEQAFEYLRDVKTYRETHAKQSGRDLEVVIYPDVVGDDTWIDPIV